MKSRRLADKPEEITSPALQFDEIASLYDELMASVPYRLWIDYLKRILKQFDRTPDTILDLCCGTGTASLLLAEAGYTISGADISPAMIAHASRKAEEKGLRVDYHVQDASSLSLGRRFGLIISLFDSLNYILESAKLQQAFYRVSEHLQPGGLFIFDMNTELALAAGLFNQSNLGSKASVRYDWHSSYDPSARVCRIQMTFTQKQRGVDKRTEVVHYQRAYDEEDIVKMLESASLKVLAVYDAYAFHKVNSRSDRMFFIAEKIV